jgi:hypothetical protein
VLSTLRSRNGPFTPQQPVVVHLTTPTTLPANQGSAGGTAGAQYERRPPNPQPAFVAHYRRSTHRLTTHQEEVPSCDCMATQPSVDWALRHSAEAMPLSAIQPAWDSVPSADTAASCPDTTHGTITACYIQHGGKSYH